MNHRYVPGICRVSIFCVAVMMASIGVQADPDKKVSQLPARPSPEWLRDGVIYEVFPRNFSLAGNFDAITAKLDELHDVGATILWLMPINPSGREKSKGTLGSPYAVKDYYAINPDYGTEDDLKRLVSEAHKRGMKVIIDIVANHTAWDSVMMQHPEFYKQDASGKIIPPVPDWSDVAGLNYDNPELRKYMITMLQHWIEPNGVNLDGFRCDVAGNVPTSFWEEARAELSKTKPDIMMLAEADKPELLVKAFDIDYNWPLLGTLNNVLINGAPATDIKKVWEENAAKSPKGALHMEISDDHDEPRAVARFGLKGAIAASALMFTLDGVPLIYNGMEVGDATESGDPALFEKMPVFWHPKDRPPIRDIYRGLLKLRAEYPAFHDGAVIWLHNSNDANVLTFMRKDDNDEFVIAINFCNRPIVSRVDVSDAQTFKLVTSSEREKPSGFPTLVMKGFEYRIYQRHIAK